jgi:hypothetical protein
MSKVRSSKKFTIVAEEAKAFTNSLNQGSKRAIPDERRKRTLQRLTTKVSCGLRNASERVYAFLEQHEHGVSINEIVEALDFLYARRRVMDVLNVLFGANVITDRKKDIKLCHRKRRKITMVPEPKFYFETDPLEDLLDTNSRSVSPP